MKRARVDTVQTFDAASNANLPKLVSFASGDDVPARAKFACFRQCGADGSRVLTAETGRLSHVNKAPPEMMMLAVVSRATGKARLVPLESYHLSPVVPQSTADTAEAATTPRPTREDVGRAFGLSRWQKMHTKLERLAVARGSSAVAQSIQAAVSQLPALPTPETVMTKTEDEDGLVPPINRAATEREDVFNRDDLVPPRLWSHLVASDNQFRDALAKCASTHEYVAKYAAVLEAEDDEERYTMLKYVFYLQRLLRYLQKMQMRKSWKQLLVPKQVLQHLRQSFMERSHQGWDRSERLMDKLVCHMLVLSLWIHRYAVDLDELAAASRVSIKKLTQYCAALGLTVTGQRAVLRLPLRPRPAVSNVRRAKKVATM